MIQESKKLAFLSAIALLIVGYSILMRVSNTIVDTRKETSATNIVTPIQYSSPEPSFFEPKSGSVSTDNAAVNPAKNIASSIPRTVSNNPFDRITAGAYLVGNIETGKIYLEKNSRRQLPVASMSKLITAIIVIETLDGASTIEITPLEAIAPPDGSGIGAGEKYTVNEILFPLLLSSSNIAAEAIASSSNRIKFLELMSEHAWKIGMPQAYFADPSGVDPHNLASSKDIFALAQYLYRIRPDILSITRTKSLEIASTSDHGAHIFTSIHPFVTDSRFIGGKTGRTKEAGETMLTILKIQSQIITFIVMGSDIGARAADTSILIGELQKKL